MSDDKAFAWIDKLMWFIPTAGITFFLALSVLASWLFGSLGFAVSVALLAMFVAWCSVMTWLLKLVTGPRGEREKETAGP